MNIYLFVGTRDEVLSVSDSLARP